MVLLIKLMPFLFLSAADDLAKDAARLAELKAAAEKL